MSQSNLSHAPRHKEPPSPRSDSPAALPLPGIEQAAARRPLRTLLQSVAVAAVLIGIAWWGHRTGWSLPEFSSLIGPSKTEVADWCAEHNVPESQCIECNSSLLAPETDYGWCKVHGISQCPFEHPEVAQLRVHPVISQVDLERATNALAIRPRAENNSNCALYRHRIQFASVDAMDKAGVEIAVVARRPIIEAVVANGEVVYDDTHTARLSSRVAGTVWRVEKQVGQSVRKGDILALIDSAEVGRAKSEFLQAIAQLRLKKTNVERLKPLADSGSVPGRSFREAEAERQEAGIRLLGAQQVLVNLGLGVRADDFADLSTEEIAERIQFLGLPPEIVSMLDVDSTTSNLFPLRAPLESVVVECNVVAGETVDAGTMIFKLSDVRQLWLTLDVPQDEARYLSLGQKVLFRPTDADGEREIEGSLAWISTEADDHTRTIKIRVNLPNADGRLRANTFGRGRIVLREEPQATVVPSEAIHSDGCCNVVFVRDVDFLTEGSPKYFHIRKVRPGVKEGDMTEVIAGLLPGEVIASKNSVVLESQLLKSSLGAGCGCCQGK